MKPACKDCRYYNQVFGELAGHCQRYPPQLNGEEFGLFPKMLSSEWCGEFKPKEIPVEITADDRV